MALDTEERVAPEGRATEDAFNAIASHPSNADLRDSLNANERNPTNNTAADTAEAKKLPIGDSNDIPYTPDGPGRRALAKKILGNKGVVAGLGVGGTAALIIALFMSLLPLKLESLISNALTSASKIPGYAVEQRTEYLITRALATRLLMLANNTDEVAGKLVFCGTGSISCSLFATYTADYFSEKMDFSLAKRSNGMVNISVNANGRQYLGGTAKSWDINIKTYSKLTGEALTEVTKEITSHSDMRAYLKTRIANELKESNVITRYVARRILMMKYGVRSWQAFEKTRETVSNKVTDITSTFKAKIYENTIGKISPRFASYLACLQGGEACEKLLDNLSTNLAGNKPERSQYGSDAEYNQAMDRYNKQVESLQKIASTVSGDVPATATDDVVASSFEKIFSKNILKAVGGAAGAAFTVDMVLSAVHSLDNGALEAIGFDQTSQEYTGFAFGDETGVVTNWEKTKAGDFDGETGNAVVSEIAQLVDCDGSTLCAYESGYPTAATASVFGSSASAASSGYQRECSTSNGVEMVTLNPGELVCPERKLYRDYSSQLTSNPVFQTLATVSDFWYNTVHPAFNLVNSLVGDAINFIGGPIMEVFKPLGTAIIQQIQPAINWFMDLVFDPPSVGYDTTPANNYDAVSGALHLSQWETMKNGVSSDGTVLGGGGAYLNEADSQKIIAYQNAQEEEEYNNQSTFAKLFDTSLKGSVAQQLVLEMPKNGFDLLKLPGKALAVLSGSSSTAIAASNVTSSPFGLPNYSYQLDDSALTANPSIYTADYCSASAAAREASLKKVDGVAVQVYTKTDPCALEKLVVGSLITDSNPTDPNAFKSLTNTTAATPTASTGSCSDTTLVSGITKGWTRDASGMNGTEKDITLCAVPGTKASIVSHWAKDKRYAGTSAIGLEQIAVNSDAASSLLKATQAAAKDQVTLTASVGYRTLYEQCSIYMQKHPRPSDCPSWVTSINEPGWDSPVLYSNHMLGYSVDLDNKSEAWMRACVHDDTSTYKNATDGSNDNRCWGFYDDVNQKCLKTAGCTYFDKAHFTYDP